MDGEKIKRYLLENHIAAKDLAADLGISPQTLSTWLKTGSLKPEQKEKLKKCLKLSTDFFSQTFNAGDVEALTRALAECEKQRAVLSERVDQLTERLKEKDETIKLLGKHLK